jgi:uncharacterized protein YjbJ (UPF0337 family)
MDENRIEGAVQETVGKVEDAAGGLTGDAGLQADGKFDQVIGTLKRNYGAASDRVGDAGRATREAARVAGREAGAMAGKAYDVGVNTEQRLAEAVKSRPLSWLIGSVALGYAIGMLVHSPSSPWAPRPRASRYFGR